MTFEFIIFVMSMVKLAQIRRRSSTTLSVLLLRDGSVYYFVLTALKITNLVMFANADVSAKSWLTLTLTN